MQTNKKIVMFIACGVCIGLVIWFTLLGRETRASQEKASKRQVLSAMPEIKSCVEHIEVVKGQLKTRSNGSQVAILELENKAYVGVTAVSVETTVGREKHTVTRSGFSPDKAPLIIIPPQERATIELSNLSANSPIRIASVMFTDGTEEGCEQSLKTMRLVKERDTKKGGGPK